MIPDAWRPEPPSLAAMRRRSKKTHLISTPSNRKTEQKKPIRKPPADKTAR